MIMSDSGYYSSKPTINNLVLNFSKAKINNINNNDNTSRL